MHGASAEVEEPSPRYLQMLPAFVILNGRIESGQEHCACRELKPAVLNFFVKTLQVFGIYFMQSYIGLFYHALFHRDFFVLRQLLIQRLIVSQVGPWHLFHFYLLLS